MSELVVPREIQNRAELQQETVEICVKGGYVHPSGKEVRFDGEQVKEGMKKTKMFEKAPVEEEWDVEVKDRNYETKIYVSEGDCVDCALNLLKKVNEGKEEQEKILLLNMANHQRPGGGWKSGARAQEEQLFRRSNYYLYLTEEGWEEFIKEERDWTYPIPDYGAIYTPEVLFFRESEENEEKNGGPYSVFPSPIPLSCIAVAAFAWPPLEVLEGGDGKPTLVEPFTSGTIEKIRTLLSVALLYGHKTLVLSALGCGAFKNPPSQIAKLFQAELTSPRFSGKFETVVFAVYTKGAAASLQNYEEFLSVFGNENGGRDLPPHLEEIKQQKIEQERILLEGRENSGETGDPSCTVM